MAYTELLFGNGYLSEQDFIEALEGLPFITELETPVYIVGLTTFKGAEGVGAWVDDNRLYLDPVCFTPDLEVAYRIAQENEQVALFKMTGVLETTEVRCPKKDPAPLYEALKHYSDKYGGATAFAVDGGFIVVGGEGEVVYL